MTHTKRLVFGVVAILVIVVIYILSTASVASANHAWGTYHWARTANPFTIKLGDNVTTQWDAYLKQASTDWSASSVLDTQVVSGNGGRTCRATSGRAEICNAKYGNNGWLGIATIWASGSHITQGTVKMNDTYFNTATYNKPAWRALVMCQEVGHIFGLGHQDETFANTNLGTCMDYTNDPTPNQHPNAHDYEMLETIYAHLDTTTTIKQTTALFGRMTLPSTLPSTLALDIDIDEPSTWGKEIGRSADGFASVFEKDFGNGQKIFRHVYWIEPRAHEHAE